MRNVSAPLGRNRTGIATSPAAAADLLAATKATRPSRPGDEAGMAQVRMDYARAGEPSGSMPPPTTARGMAKTALRLLQGKKATVLLDKLGERLAFERSGTRLYEALLSKYDAYGSWPDGPTRGDLAHIHDEEREHFLMLKQAIESLGADPTAVTPSANVHAVASDGLPAVLADPRTNLQQCLEVILVAELVDNDCWENLIDLATALGVEDIADKARQALQQEREHLNNVRRWLGASLSHQAVGHLSAPFAARGQARAEAMAARADGGHDGNAQAPETSHRSRQPQRRRRPRAQSTKGTRGKRARGARNGTKRRSSHGG